MDALKKYRLIIVLAVILLVSFVTVSFLNYQAARRAVRDEIITSSLPLLRENLYSEILKGFMAPLSISSAMATDSFLVDWALAGEKDLAAITQYLSLIRDRYGYFSAFFVSSRTGAYYHPGGILKRISRDDPHDVWYYLFADSGLDFDLDVDTNEAADNSLTIFITYRLKDFSGGFLGVTGVGLEMEGFSGFLAENASRYHRKIYLTDPEGIIQAHSETALIEAVSIRDLPGIKEVADTLLRADTGPNDASYEGESGSVLVTSLYMPEIDWFLFVEQEEAASLVSVRRSLRRTLSVGLIASLLIILLSAVTVQRFQRRLEIAAVTDELTKTANRREFENHFRKAAYRFERYRAPFSLIMLDIDRFKTINDTDGHAAGDEVLIRLTMILKEYVREGDLVARFGGDEFVLLLECPSDEAVRTAERLRAAVSDARIQIPSGKTLAVTISLGVASVSDTDTMGTILSRADAALYRAKEEGRNRVVAL